LADIVGHVLIGTLIVGFPIAVALAWYHGHKGATRLSAGEMAVVSLLLVIGAGLLIVLVRPTNKQVSVKSVAPSAPNPATETISTPSASVAVVPFLNLTGDVGKEYFSDGLAEELINELTRVPGLKVPARTSSFAYKGRNIDVRQIARELRVATILEGSVRSAGERIRVTAQLVNAETGYHVWSKTYNGSFGDVFKLEDDISAEIIEALKSSMHAQLPAVAAQAPPTADPEAYRFYLQGRSAPTDVAMRLFAQATTRDPRFARAWAAMAIERVVAAAFGAVIPNALADAEHDANQALALDPNLPEAQTALGIISAWRGNWTAAEASFRRAVELAPDDASPRVFRAANTSCSAGHLRQGAQELQEAYALAPASGVVVSVLAAVYSMEGQNDAATKYAELGDALGGSRDSSLRAYSRSTAALRRGHYAEAGEIILPTLPAPLRSPAASLTVRRVFMAFGASNDRMAASRALTTLVGSVKPDDLGVQPRQDIISWYATLGDMDAAFDFANRSVDEFARAGTVGTTWGGLWIQEMRSFRKDPRFQAFVTRLKLPDYWKQYGPPDGCDLAGERLVCR